MSGLGGGGEIMNALIVAAVCALKVGTHKGSSGKDLLQGLVHAKVTHTVHSKGLVSGPCSVYMKSPVAGTLRLWFLIGNFFFNLVARTSRANSPHEGTNKISWDKSP